MTAPYALIHKDPQANKEYRLKLGKWAKDNPAAQKLIIEECKRNTLYFINNFLWLFEPRGKDNDGVPVVLPFVTWPHQDKMINVVEPLIGKKDMGIEKARGEGASWCFLGLLFKRWLWVPKFSVGLVSRDEETVDSPTDPDSLFWKLDFMLENLPRWMVPKGFDASDHRSKTRHVLMNPENGATFVGYAATGKVGSGGRKTVFVFDELSKFRPGEDYSAVTSTQQTTRSRIFIATPNGPRGAYYDLMHDPKSSLVKVVLDWQENPTRNPGLYTSERGALKIIDKSYQFPPDYPFVLDGWVRSPWFDEECVRGGATRRAIMQELMRHYGGNNDPFFEQELVDRLKGDCREPYHRGALKYDRDDFTPHWEEKSEGLLKLWIHLDMYGNPPLGRYIVGCDVSNGTGGEWSSNSVAFVLDAKTGEQVAEFAVNSPDFRPFTFAEWTTALCKWFHGAFLIWEANGPGEQFTSKMIDIGYDNVYFRETKETGIYKKTRKMGFWSQADNRADLFGGSVRGGGLEEAVRSNGLIIRSIKLLEECSQYVFENGKVVHRQSKESQDQAARGKAHGDRVVAAALAWLGRIERPAPKHEPDRSCPVGSFGWRRELSRKAEMQTRW